MRYAILGVLLASLIAACGKDANILTPDNVIHGHVTDALTRYAVSGIGIQLMAPRHSDPIAVDSTDQGGNYRFADIDSGTYNLRIITPDYYQFDAQVIHEGANSVRDFDLTRDTTGIGSQYYIP